MEIKLEVAEEYWHFWTLMLEKTPDKIMDSQQNKQMDHQANQLRTSMGGIRPGSTYPTSEIWRPSSLKKGLILGKLEEKRRQENKQQSKWITVVMAPLLGDWRTLLVTNHSGEKISMWLLRVDVNLMIHN